MPIEITDNYCNYATSNTKKADSKKGSRMETTSFADKMAGRRESTATRYKRNQFPCLNFFVL